MSDQDYIILLRVNDSLGGGHVVGQRFEWDLHRRDGETLLFQKRNNFSPT